MVEQWREFAAQRRDGDIYPYAPDDAITISAIAAMTAQQMQTTVLRQRSGDGIDEQYVDQLGQEYRQIALDLHDGIVQDLACLRPRLEALERVISTDHERAVVGIVREALQNIRKHADASRVRVKIQRASGELQAMEFDDGSGFAGMPGRSGVHFGVEQMRELAEDMGGSLRIVREAQRGTRVVARIPLVPGGKGIA